MIMKIITLLSILAVAAGCVQAKLPTILTPTWRVTLKVVDDAGKPVASAKATVDYLFTNQIAGLTDTNGIFIASHRDKSFALAFNVKKNGYYSFWQRYEMGFPEQYNEAKWNPTVQIVLKRMIKPIEMYAKWVNTKVPDLDKPIGYDLMAGDWVTPYGKGFHSDILFTGHFNYPASNESDFTLTVTFPNQKDGIQEFEETATDKASELHSSQAAPEIGYQPEWIQTNNWKNGQPFKTNRSINRNYYFRVRTVLDKNGNIESALYGKIYGDFMDFRYYLNPTPNDRSVEFDQHDLIKDLNPLDGVKEP